MQDILVTSPNEITFEGIPYRCAIGANGFTHDPKEGDKATPKGLFALRECWYRADRIEKPVTVLPLKIIKPDDGWCDDPKHPDYNLHVKLPFAGNHEKLWRRHHIYDIIVPLGFNDDPVVPGLGSAIFFHIAKEDYSPTLGCVAVSLKDMLQLLSKIKKTTRIKIG